MLNVLQTLWQRCHNHCTPVAAEQLESWYEEFLQMMKKTVITSNLNNIIWRANLCCFLPWPVSHKWMKAGGWDLWQLVFWMDRCRKHTVFPQHYVMLQCWSSTLWIWMHDALFGICWNPLSNFDKSGDWKPRRDGNWLSSIFKESVMCLSLSHSPFFTVAIIPFV